VIIFSSVFIKKSNQTKFFLKKTKTGSNRFFLKKILVIIFLIFLIFLIFFSPLVAVAFLWAQVLFFIFLISQINYIPNIDVTRLGTQLARLGPETK